MSLVKPAMKKKAAAGPMVELLPELAAEAVLHLVAQQQQCLNVAVLVTRSARNHILQKCSRTLRLAIGGGDGPSHPYQLLTEQHVRDAERNLQRVRHRQHPLILEAKGSYNQTSQADGMLVDRILRAATLHAADIVVGFHLRGLVLPSLLAFSPFTRLTTLSVRGNGIAALDLRQCAQLQAVDVSFSSALHRLDLPQSLTNLNCHDCPTLLHVNFRAVPALEHLDCSGCDQLPALPLQHSRSLKHMDCSNCPSLADAQLPASLQHFNCSDCESSAWSHSVLQPLKSLHTLLLTDPTLLAGLPSSTLTTRLTSLCILGDRDNTAAGYAQAAVGVRSLTLSMCHMAHVDLTANRELRDLRCVECPALESIDLTNMGNLSHVNVSDCCELAALSLQSNTSLVELNCSGCESLESLLLPQSLARLTCSWCASLPALQLDAAPDLHHLNCDHCNLLESLNLSANARLREVTCIDCAALEHVCLSAVSKPNFVNCCNASGVVRLTFA